MNQLSLDFARAQCDRGMALAEQGAINACEDWPDLALAYLRRYAETHEQFPMFFVTQAAERDPAMPQVNPKAWGQVTRFALKAGIIAKTGTFMPHPRRHACPALVFKSLICLRALVADQCPLPKDRLELARAHHAHTGAV